jgi:hypothetical protein
MDYFKIQVTEVKSVNKRNTAQLKSFDQFLDDNFLLHKKTIELIRSISDKEKIAALKNTLPACQFCITNGRGVDGILKYSNVMQIDIDAKDNPHISNLKDVIRKVPYIFYAMYSASGKGVFALINITSHNHYKDYFDAFKIFMKAKFGVIIDSAVSSPASLRFWSYDDAPVINEEAAPWNYVSDVTAKKSLPDSFYGRNRDNNPFDDFNKHGNVESLLISHGWTYQPGYSKGTRKRYTRPGKSKGVSADWCTEKRVLYAFSNAPETGLPDGGKGYNPASTFCLLECKGDFKLCYSKLRALRFGKA